jgi:hypothetical protein
MSIHFNNRLKNSQYLLNILFGRKSPPDSFYQQKNFISQITLPSTSDTVTISDAARALSAKKTSAGRSLNRSVDKSIDLQKYIDAAKKSNADAIKNAGDEITGRAAYTSTGQAFREALTEKYSKLAAEAKNHANPENYIYQKYFDKGFKYYETDLSDTERQAAYNYELQMYTKGKINGVNYQDSLFRGIEVSGDVVDNDQLQFQRQVVNSQIANILQKSGINTAEIPAACELTVDPYTYEISVDGTGTALKTAMESALNAGSNGKNLFNHIYKCATQDGSNSTQVSSASYVKYRAYQQTYQYTGLKLNELTEKDGTYYTNDGTDIKDLVKKSVDEASDVPAAYKGAAKEAICSLISEISQKGWDRVSDMSLSIFYGKDGLADTKQAISYGKNFSAVWYSVV